MKKCCKNIEKFKQTGIWVEDNIISNACDNGHLFCLKYAHKNKCPLNENSCTNAAWRGDIDCLKYSHENGFYWDDNTTATAAWRGNFDCLKYAHENGCPWDEKTTSYAAEYGYLDCIKYSIDKGCPWDEKSTLFYIDSYSSRINLDDNWWRTFLFDKDFTSHTKLKRLIDAKKEEIKQLQVSSEILFSYVPKDVVKYILWAYF